MTHAHDEDENDMAAQDALKPCPFCGLHLEKSATFSRKTAAVFVHPDSDYCLAQNTIIKVSDRPDDKERVASWNRRALSTEPGEAVNELSVEEFRAKLAEQCGKTMVAKMRIAELEATLPATVQPVPEGAVKALEFAKGILERAEEELRMIRMKDSAALYDVGLRSFGFGLAHQKIDAALAPLSNPEAPAAPVEAQCRRKYPCPKCVVTCVATAPAPTANYETSLSRLRKLVAAADAIRTAQREYMDDRGNERKGMAVANAADAYDRLREQKPSRQHCKCNSLTNPCIVCGLPKFIDRAWLKRKIEEDGEEGEIGAGFEMLPLPTPPDPMVILAGIKHFGLASDGSDLRDLEAALSNAQAAPATMTVQGEVETLREALKPFAKEAAGWSPEQNGGHIFLDGERADETNLTVGDFRRAASALAGEGSLPAGRGGQP